MIDHTGPSLHEDTLVERAQSDSRAFGALYDRYRGPIYHHCLGRLGSHPDAEDATSDVFAKALAGLDRYRSGSFRCWLFTIARNVVVDTTRRRRIHLSVDGIDHPLDTEPTPEEAVVRAEERSGLRGILEMLPSGERAVLVLRNAGYSTLETAEHLGRSPGAIKLLKFRATSRLRRLMPRPQIHHGGTDR